MRPINPSLNAKDSKEETVTVQQQLKTANRVPEYQSVQSTRVYRVPEHTGVLKLTDCQSIKSTRVYRLPECIEYQSVQNTSVYRLPECTDYQSVESTRVPECAEYQSVTVNSVRGYPSFPSKESDTKSDMEETRATGGNHPLAEFQIIMQKMEQMELQA